MNQLRNACEDKMPPEQPLFTEAIITFTCIIAGFLITSLILSMLFNNDNETLAINPFFAFATYLIIPTCLWIFYKRNHYWVEARLKPPYKRSKLFWRLILISILFMLVCSILYGMIIQILQISWLMPPAPDNQLILLGNGAYLFLNILIVAFWAPLNEELLFRNFLIPIISTKYGSFPAATISSALFSLMHIELSLILPVFLLGLCLSWLFLKTQSVWPCIFAHSIWNILVIVVGFLI